MKKRYQAGFIKLPPNCYPDWVEARVETACKMKQDLYDLYNRRLSLLRIVTIAWAIFVPVFVWILYIVFQPRVNATLIWWATGFIGEFLGLVVYMSLRMTMDERVEEIRVNTSNEIRKIIECFLDSEEAKVYPPDDYF